MSESESEYGAILVDTSIFDGHALKLEKGLLGKLSQFKKSPIEFILPDVIMNEIKKHLESKIKTTKTGLEKALNDANDHLFFDGSELNDAKKTLIDSKEIDGLAESRLTKFIESTGALVLETGKYVSVSELLEKYFSNMPPFAETGKKKNEFPDAIVLMAVEAWAKSNETTVLAIAKDNDWAKYCENSTYVDYKEDLSLGLEQFNKTNAPYTLLANLETALISGGAQNFLDGIASGLDVIFDGFTPDADADADSRFYWEPEGCHGWFKKFELVNHDFRIIDQDDNWVVLEALANITVEAEGEFTLSIYDSIDRDYVKMAGISASVEEEFESAILITISGNLNSSIDALNIDDIEVIDPIDTIHFGTLEPDYEVYEED